MKNIFEELPLNHFGLITNQVIDLLLAGQSVTVYGMPGCGRTYFGKIIQLNLDNNPACLKVFHFTSPIGSIKPDKEIIDTLITQLHLNRRNFQHDLQHYLTTRQVILIFARTEEYFQNTKVATLLNRLRDISIGKLVILTCFEDDIIVNYSYYGNLCRSLFLNLVPIPPFDLAGTKRILETNPKKNNQPYSPIVIKKILTLSGGNPALIKYLGLAVQNNSSEALNNINVLIHDPAIGVKLSNLYAVTISQTESMLQKLGIIKTNKKLFSPLLEHYLKTYELDNIDEIIPGLTSQERKILTYFLKNKGKLITKDRLAFWLGLTTETFSLWAIYQAVSRLKRKIKGKYQLKTLKDQGYIFTKM